jgi:3-oxoadipate enol-lactonase
VGFIAFVHAFGSSSRAWAPQLQALGERHRVLAVDLPGHGEAPGPFTLDRAVEAVRAATEGVGERAWLVGISGGAAVCALTCIKHPSTVGGLVLSGGFARVPRAFVVQRTMTRVLPEPVLARVMRGALSGGRTEYAPMAAEQFRRCGKRTFVAALDQLVDLDLRARLGQVGVPVLVLCGTKDRPNIPLSRELAAGIPGAELRLVPDANHLWNLQQPDAFNETVAGFIDGVVPPTASP